MKAARVGTSERGWLYVSTTETMDGDLDLIAIEYAVNGRPVKLTPEEKLCAARILDSQGLAMKAIGRQVGANPLTVQGWKDNGWKPGKHPQTRTREKRPEPVCGEPRMYRRHLKNGERCDVCRAANAAADRRYRLTGSQAA